MFINQVIYPVCRNVTVIKSTEVLRMTLWVTNWCVWEELRVELFCSFALKGASSGDPGVPAGCLLAVSRPALLVESNSLSMLDYRSSIWIHTTIVYVFRISSWKRPCHYCLFNFFFPEEQHESFFFFFNFCLPYLRAPSLYLYIFLFCSS